MIWSMQDQGDREPPPGDPAPEHTDEPVRERHWWARDQNIPFPPSSGGGGEGGRGDPGMFPPGLPPRPPGRPPHPERRRDPGAPRAAWIAGILATLLILAVAGLQQLSALSGPQQPPGVPTAPPVEASSATFEITAKFYTRIYNAFPEDQVARDAVRGLVQSAQTPSDDLRIVMVEADVRDAETALKRLDEMEHELSGPLLEDARTLRQIYTGEDPSPEQLTQLIDNHGWFGELAATYDDPITDPQRAQVVGGGMLTLGLLIGLMAVGLAALVTGSVLLILAIVWFSSGRMRTRFVPPLPGGSVAIETVAVFVAAFLILKVGAGFLALGVGEETAVWASMLLQWLLLLTLLWPLVRGVTFKHTLALWGLHRGRGVLREIGAGFVGYLACLPLLMVGVIATLVLMMLYQAIRYSLGMPEAPPPNNPIFEIVSQPGGWLMVVLLVLLASVWAPLAEEVVFRGALYRHLRGRWHWLVSGLVTALAFGVMHGYQVFMLGPVIALGFGFALLREWRGSLIASITAHALHNSMVLTILIVVLRVVMA